MDKSINKPIKYSQWQSGIADSPTDGFADIRNCNIERYPGSITPGFKVNATSPVTFTATVTRVGASDFVQFNAGTSIPYIGQAVTFSAPGGGITAGQIYYLTTQLQIVSGTIWEAPIALNIPNALNNTAVSLSAGVTGNITGIVISTVMDFKTYFPPFYASNPLVFCIDSNSRVWVQDNITNTGTITATKNNWYYLPRTNTDTATAADTNTQGLTIFQSGTTPSKSWLFAAFNNVLSVIEVDTMVLSSTIPAWTANFNTFNTVNYHRGFISQSGFMYFTDGQYLFGFTELNGQTFSGTKETPTKTTYATGSSAILPSYEIGSCLDNLGDNLIIGGLNSNLLYPYNELTQTVTVGSVTQIFVSAQTPIRVGEKGIYQIKNINNTLYILAGAKGIVYYTTGYVVLPLKKVPEYLTGGSIHWGGIEKIDGNLLFGFLGSQGDANGVLNGGVGKIYLTEQAQSTSIIANGVLFIDQSTVINPTTTLPTSLYTFILPLPVGTNPTSTIETYYIGSVNGVDVVDTSTVRSDGSSYVVCPFEKVSSLKDSRTFQSIGIELLQSLASTQNVNINYRTELNGSFVAVNPSANTFTATSPDNGSLISMFGNTVITGVNTVQLKIFISSDGGRNPILSNLQLQ